MIRRWLAIVAAFAIGVAALFAFLVVVEILRGGR